MGGERVLLWSILSLLPLWSILSPPSPSWLPLSSLSLLASFTHSLSHTHKHAHTLSHSLTHTHTHAVTRTHALTHARARAHTPTHACLRARRKGTRSGTHHSLASCVGQNTVFCALLWRRRRWTATVGAGGVVLIAFLARSCQPSVQMDLDMYNSLLECAAGIAHATAANMSDMHSSNWRLGSKDGLRLIAECQKDRVRPDLVSWSGVCSLSQSLSLSLSLTHTHTHRTLSVCV